MRLGIDLGGTKIEIIALDDLDLGAAEIDPQPHHARVSRFASVR